MSAVALTTAALLATANALPQWGSGWGNPWNGGGNPWWGGNNGNQPQPPKDKYLVSLGPRPYYIVENMTDSPLKTKLQSCENVEPTVNQFVIGHRGGGTLQFPEETAQSEQAGARMGAGILECDVSFTADRGLVCRHSLCDLHTTVLSQALTCTTTCISKQHHVHALSRLTFMLQLTCSCLQLLAPLPTSAELLSKQ